MRLRHVSDSMPGIERIRRAQGFIYRHPDGPGKIDAETRERIRKLAIPPAYNSVWICPLPNGHLQAVGRDARGRKQYRYHASWRSTRDAAKFDRLLAFGEILPALRQRVANDLALPGLPRERVLAAVVRLLETTLARVGNPEYARTNCTFGLTTLRNRHVRVKGDRLTFDFRGKHGIQHNINLADRRLAAIVRRCRDLPGQELFRFLDEEGAPRLIGSEDVNEYLKELTGHEITAKDFRTWAGTVFAAVTLRDFEPFTSQTQAKKNLLQAIDQVAELLRNTRAICRKCYIHPAIFDGYLDGGLLTHLREPGGQPIEGLTEDESAVLTWLTRGTQTFRRAA
jgi:DNA topoisomerase I